MVRLEIIISSDQQYNSGLLAAITKVNCTLGSVTFKTLADPVQAFDGIFVSGRS